jgi:hypothetical protein
MSMSMSVSGRGRKRGPIPSSSDDEAEGMRGMEVLAESAQQRLAAEDEEERDESPGRAGGPRYECAYCAKTFSRPSSLRIHIYSRESCCGKGKT